MFVVMPWRLLRELDTDCIITGDFQTHRGEKCVLS